MHKGLMVLALAVAVAVLAAWAITGAHQGWTKTQVGIPKTDPVTGLDYQVIEHRIVFGLDFLGLGLAGAAAVAASSIALPRILKISSNRKGV